MALLDALRAERVAREEGERARATEVVNGGRCTYGLGPRALARYKRARGQWDLCWQRRRQQRLRRVQLCREALFGAAGASPC
jgi:hypothetical protein